MRIILNAALLSMTVAGLALSAGCTHDREDTVGHGNSTTTVRPEQGTGNSGNMPGGNMGGGNSIGGAGNTGGTAGVGGSSSSGTGMNGH